MKILKLILISTLTFFATFAKANDSIYIQELDKYCKVIDYEVLNDDTINFLISYSDQELRYGKWKFHYENGNKKSEGVFSFEGIIHCATGPGPHIPHYFERRIGKWKYWDESGNPRTDLYGEEMPSEGHYKHFTSKGQLYQEGYFEDGKIVNGKRYSYHPKENYIIRAAVFENGKYVGEE